MKIFLLAPKENWICDRFVSEWYSHNSKISTHDINDADIVWLVAGWCWNQVPLHILNQKKVVITIHHIVPEKFDDTKLQEFKFRDQFIDLYHVPCEKTKKQLSLLTSKPIQVIHFWINQNLWFDIPKKQKLKEQYKIDKESFLVGSFQRDTEGSDLKSPKLEKGPDLFYSHILRLIDEEKNVQVLLAGWRRQYIINKLQSSGIKFYYFELPNLHTVNELYNCLDLYVVSARCEGGPQSIVECAASKTPIVSTDVGIASVFLNEKSIFDNSWKAIPDVDFAYDNIKEYKIPTGFEKFKHMFFNLHRAE